MACSGYTVQKKILDRSRKKTGREILQYVFKNRWITYRQYFVLCLLNSNTSAYAVQISTWCSTLHIFFFSYFKLFPSYANLSGCFFFFVCIIVPEIYTNIHCNRFISCTVNCANILFSISLGFVTNANVHFCFML